MLMAQPATMPAHDKACERPLRIVSLLSEMKVTR